ncbi:CTP synthase [Chitinivibrio alkaliphilus]|uniref:CTP synthase n=1 Tax=Chitinivibrio alkaliphilus ACht1 TaxID=1313304 RepID=U7D4L7_9BACT|nr:CTP synthase [Chitinivibrio alkaliphilus]ERP31459.1 CTP synthase [Chitinivibrio alkaliphilus ACht1]
MPKHIFITGGVVSSLGKGITAASIGLLLKSRGLKVILQKFDPYLNVDPGTMNPYEHGEVYVTDDGTETDLDLGHYERFTGVSTNKYCNFTAGKIYDSILRKERRGDFLGGTVQVVPHVTGEICRAIHSFDNSDVDIVITEIGGTVGDIEGLPFLEALRQFRLKKGAKNVFFIHVTLIPFLSKAGEVKTKPTQHSVGRLREIGIIPDMLVCRTEKHLQPDVMDKLSLFCNVDRDNVIEAFDVDQTIYQVPLAYAEQNIDTIILDYFGLASGKRSLDKWREYTANVSHATSEINIAVVGKYSELIDAYKSIHEALDHSGAQHGARIHIHSIKAEDIEADGAEHFLASMDGILIPGGFGKRGHEGKIEAIRFAREQSVPFFGICLGMQMAVVEFARNVMGLAEANSTELNESTKDAVIALMEEQHAIEQMGGTMRLGSYPCQLTRGSLAHTLYGEDTVHERHRHRFEFSNSYYYMFEEKGMVFSGHYKEKNLVEIVELTNHPFFMGVQFHPEFKSRPVAPHPLFSGFVHAAKTFHSSK